MITERDALDRYNAAFPDCTAYLEFPFWLSGVATLDGDFTAEKLRMIADLLDLVPAG